MLNLQQKKAAEADFFGALETAGLLELALRIRRDEPLARKTTMRVGGSADLYIEPCGLMEIASLVKAARKAGLPYFIKGNGSNIVVSDLGIEGLVVDLGDSFAKTWTEPDPDSGQGILLHAFAGAMLSKVAYRAAKEGYDGTWFAAGIPGSIGGAVYMNAGAYGGQMSDIVYRTVYIDSKDEIAAVTGEEHEFSYRNSVFTKNKGVILSTTLKLIPGDRESILDKIATLNAKRSASQPLNLPSAGSAFKRPEGHFAGTLIQEAGLKGHSIGGAQVSEKHAGFIVNKGGATADDVYRLMCHVRQVVHNNTGIELEPEILFVGRGFADQGD